MEDRSEMEIERKVGVKVSELMKEIDQIITFLRALNDDVGLRFNKLLAQVDNMTAPLTNAVIKMEEVADHLSAFRESTQKVLGTMSLFAEQPAPSKTGVSYQAPDLGDVAKQVAAIRDETSRALEAVKMISGAVKQVPTGKGAGVEVQLPELGEVTRQISTIKEAGLDALETIMDLEEATKRVQRDLLGTETAAKVAAQSPQTQPTATASTPPTGGPPIPPSPPPEHKVTPPPATAPPPTPSPSKAAPVLKSRPISSSVDQVFLPIEEAINSNAGSVAKAILDARDKIMNMTRKFGAIYELASTARDLARHPERPLDKREKDEVMDKVGSWKQKLSDALSSS